ncbi:MAG: hypothetical protein ACUVSJ_10530 [Anaerolineae bacterium]
MKVEKLRIAISVLVVALFMGLPLVTVALAEDPPPPEVTTAEEPTVEVTEEPTEEATEEPTEEATEEPTVEVTEEPTAEVTEEPTAEVTEEPTAEATPEELVEEIIENVEEEIVEPAEGQPTEVVEEIAAESADVVAGAAPSSYTSCFQLANLSGSTANINIGYYSQSTGLIANPSDTISGNSSKTYCPLSAVPSGFNGSVVVSSTQPLAAIANIAGDPSFAGFMASYSGFSGGASIVSLPLLMKNNYGYSTWFNVQNVGSANASVSISYSDGTIASATIAPGRAKTFNQLSESHSNGWVGAGRVSATGAEIAVTVVEVGATVPQLFAYNGFPSAAAATNPVMPLVQANNYGYFTGIQIQNTGSSSTNVTVTYTPAAAGTACTETKAIPPGQSRTFALYAFSNSFGSDPYPGTNNCNKTARFIGSARVTTNSTNQGLVAIVNQVHNVLGKGAAYGSFNPANATSEVIMPLIADRNYGYYTGFNIQNVGSTSTTVTCTFSGSSKTLSETLDPGQALNSVQGPYSGWLNLGAGYVGSGTCTASGGGKIVGVVNYVSDTGGDTLMVYEGINQ